MEQVSVFPGGFKSMKSRWLTEYTEEQKAREHAEQLARELVVVQESKQLANVETEFETSCDANAVAHATHKTVPSAIAEPVPPANPAQSENAALVSSAMRKDGNKVEGTAAPKTEKAFDLSAEASPAHSAETKPKITKRRTEPTEGVVQSSFHHVKRIKRVGEPRFNATSDYQSLGSESNVAHGRAEAALLDDPDVREACPDTIPAVEAKPDPAYFVSVQSGTTSDAKQLGEVDLGKFGSYKELCSAIRSLFSYCVPADRELKLVYRDTSGDWLLLQPDESYDVFRAVAQKVVIV